MYKFIRTVALTALLTTMMVSISKPAQAQLIILDIIKAATKKVIRQIDLHVQKMQNKTIALQNTQKALENSFSKNKLQEINGWLAKQRKLYDEYYQELRKVKEVISAYREVRSIASRQLQLIDEYHKAYELFRQGRHFTEAELRHMKQVYTGIIEESARNLEQVYTVASSFKTQMSDGARLELIQAASTRMDELLTDLRSFNREATALAVQRTREQQDIYKVQKIYDLTK